MKKIILLFFALFFLGCKTTNTATKTSDENAQVSAGIIEVKTDALAKELEKMLNELKSLEKYIGNTNEAIDGMKRLYKEKEAECEYYKKSSELLKSIIRNILDENPEEKENIKKYNKEVYDFIYKEEL